MKKTLILIIATFLFLTIYVSAQKEKTAKEFIPERPQVAPGFDFSPYKDRSPFYKKPMAKPRKEDGDDPPFTLNELEELIKKSFSVSVTGIGSKGAFAIINSKLSIIGDTFEINSPEGKIEVKITAINTKDSAIDFTYNEQTVKLTTK